ncbi:hypothetical protein H4R35_006557 [Dimargaris xerosporica]|nr:hypothetical protein H4R35_006557 [Dimargaris xerosporica]
MTSSYEASPHSDNGEHFDREASPSNAPSTPNRWAEIRRQSTNSSSAWDRIRQNTINNSPNPYDHVEGVRNGSSSSANKRHESGALDRDWDQSSLPRTREAMEARTHSGNVRTNQYGDIMDD